MWGANTLRREDDAYAAFAAGPQATVNPTQHYQPPPPQQQGPPQGQGGPPAYNAGGWDQPSSETSRLGHQQINSRGSGDDGDDYSDDEGALSSTINLVTSAASMFFKAPAPPQQQGPPLQQESAKPSGPPPPIDPPSSMLDMGPPTPVQPALPPPQQQHQQSTVQPSYSQYGVPPQVPAAFPSGGPSTENTPGAATQLGYPGVAHQPAGVTTYKTHEPPQQTTSQYSQQMLGYVDRPPSEPPTPKSQNYGSHKVPSNPPTPTSSIMTHAFPPAATMSPIVMLPSLGQNQPVANHPRSLQIPPTQSATTDGGAPPVASMMPSRLPPTPPSQHQSPIAASGYPPKAWSSSPVASGTPLQPMLAASQIPPTRDAHDSNQTLETINPTYATPEVVPPVTMEVIPKATPPSSPPQRPTTPETPQMTNQTTSPRAGAPLPSPKLSQQTPDTKSGTSTPKGFSLPPSRAPDPSPGRFRRLKAPPPKTQSTPRGHTPRGKFKLPPARKPNITPLKSRTSGSPARKYESDPSASTQISATVETPRMSNSPVVADKIEQVADFKEKKVEEVKPPQVKTKELIPEEYPAVNDSLAPTKPESTADRTSSFSTLSLSDSGSTTVPTVAKGWTETMDPGTGRKYYFNAETQETRWEMPAEEGVVTESQPSQAVNTAGQEVINHNLSTKPAVEETVTKQTGADSNWVEVTDPASGSIYFYNSVTQETSWEKPKNFVAPSSEEVKPDTATESHPVETSTVKENTLPVEQPMHMPDEGQPPTGSADEGNSRAGELAEPAVLESKDPTREVVPPLPAGWSEICDENTGQSYFVNNLTQETSWTRPEASGELNTTIDEIAEATKPSKAGTDIHQQEAVAPELVNEVAVPERTTADSTEANELTRESGVNEFAITEVDEPNLSSKKEAPDDELLPPGWTKAYDESSGRFYFFNVVTQETTWTLPRAPEDAAADSNNIGTSTDATQEITASMKMAFDDHSNDPATSISEEKVASPEQIPVQEPLEVEDTALESEPNAEEAVDLTEDTLPPGWAEGFDESTGRPYYYNSSTSETSWTRPGSNDEAVVATSTAQAASSTYETASKASEEFQASTGIQVSKLEQENADLAPELTTGDGSRDASEKLDNDQSELPPGWSEVYDESSGRNYYFNSLSQETTWTRPGSVDDGNVGDMNTTMEEMIAASKPSEPSTVGIMGMANPAEVEPTKEVEPPVSEQRANEEAAVEHSGFDTQEVPTSEDPVSPTVDDQVDHSESEYAEEVEESEYVSVSEADRTHESGHDSVRSLPEGWGTAVDPYNGSTYYVNNVTGDTSFIHPMDVEESSAYDTTSVGGEDQILDTNKAGDENENGVESEVADSSHLPEQTTSTELNNKGAEEIEVALDAEPKIIEGEDDRSPDADLIEDSSQANDDLPDGWTEVLDPSSGQIYFYHEPSGESTWERPGAAGANEEIVDETVSLEDEGATSQEPEVQESEGENEPEQTTLLGSLPDGWSEMVDPSSGNTYYYHDSTGESTWDRPVGTVSGETDENVDVGAHNEVEVVSEQPEDSDEQEEEEVEAEDSEESESPDEVTGEDMPPAGSASAVSLPEGWSEVLDETSGQYYFVNSITGVSTWERPGGETISADDDDGAVGNAASAEENTEVEEYLEGESADQEDAPEMEDEPEQTPSSLPEGWTEVLDPSTGQIYYYNSINGESSWTRPDADGETNKEEEEEEYVDENDDVGEEITPDMPETQTSVDDEGQVGESENVADEPEQANDEAPAATRLPEGWIEATDPSSGNIYYYNTISEETSWERPNEPTEESLPTEGDDGVTQPESLSPNEAFEPEEAGTAEDGRNDEPEQTSLNGLPHGWVEAVDPSSGKTYYYNSVSGETSWDRPDTKEPENSLEPLESSWGDLDVDDDIVETTSEAPETVNTEDADVAQEETLADGISAGKEVEERTAESEEPANMDLPDGWSQDVDPRTGQTYYYNELTDETSWTHPNADVPSATEDDEGEATASSGNMEDEGQVEPETAHEEANDIGTDGELPPGWEEVVDPDSGAIYYYNSATALTSWEKPRFDESATLDDDNEPPESTVETRIRDEPDDRPEQEDIPGPDDGDESLLPPGWTQHVDPGSGKFYFYNADLGETSWDRPTITGTNEDSMPEGAHGTADVDGVLVEGGDFNTELMAEGEAEEWVHVDEPHEDSQAPAAIGYTPAEEPESTNDVQQTVASENTTSEEATVDLPSGWVELVDSDSGVPYYLNEENGLTTWERPTVDGQLDSNPESNVVSDPILDNTGTEEDVQEEPAQGFIGSSDDAILPDEVEGVSGDVPPKVDDDHGHSGKEEDLPYGWDALVDPQSGEYYYVNSETQETTWERPLAIAAHPEDDIPQASVGTGDLQAESQDQNEVPQENAPEPVEPSSSDLADGGATEDANDSVGLLPDGWEEAVDESSGKTYYFNEMTGETSWDPPANPPTDDAVQADVVGSPEGRPEDEIPQSLQETDPFAVNTGATTQCPEAEQPPLPPGWIEMTDPDSGEIYYWNEQDDTTAWERPSAEDADEHGGIDATHENETSDPHDADEQEAPDGDDLPSGWEKIVDPTSGETYFYHRDSNTTSWELPVVEETDNDANEEILQHNDEQLPVEPNPAPFTEEQDNAPENTSPSDLPAGWERVADPASGGFYYYNSETNETSWEPPVSEMGFDVNEDADLDEIVPAENPEVAGGNDEGIDDGWEEVVDPTSGQTYYYNQAEDLTSWERPEALVTQSESSKLPTENTLEPPSAGVSALAIVEDGKHDCGIDGPLNAADEDKVFSYIEMKVSSNPEDLLWHLVLIAARSKGRLRSKDGALDASSPDSAIVELLLGDDTSSPIVAASDGAFDASKEKAATKDDAIQSMERVQGLLLRGKRHEAVDEAIRSGDYATALMVASLCDQAIYQNTIKSYAEKVFLRGSPLHTVALLFSEQLEPAISGGSSLWGGDSNELKQKWKYHLAAIISNRIVGWDQIVLSLGDRLNEYGNIQAAHFCYMVCGLSVTSPTNPNTRLVLLGCDHKVQDNVELLTEDAVFSYERTEAYEWAKRRGNPSATIKSFQPFKLIYATMLADLGYEENSKRLTQSIRQCVDVNETNGRRTSEVASKTSFFDDRDAFAAALSHLEHRLRIQATPVVEKDATSGQERLALSDHSNPIDRAESDKPKMPPSKYVAPPSIHDMPAPTAQVQVQEAQSRSVAAASSPPMAFNPSTGSNNETSVEDSFISARSNLLDVTGYSLDPANDDPRVGGRSSSTTTNQRPSTVLETPSEYPLETATPKPQPAQQPLQYMSTPKDETQRREPAPVAATPKETKKTPEKPPMSAPAVMVGKKNKTPKTKQGPSSSDRGGWSSGIRSWMTKKLNPDAHQVTLEESGEKPYYDEKRKVWVFPGDNPEELAKPIGPPPTMGKAAGDSAGAPPTPATEEPKTAAPMDPLAAMMAPPSARLPKRSVGGSAMGTPSRGYPGMPSPMMGASPMAAPPQFAVFQPKPASSSSKEDDPK